MKTSLSHLPEHKQLEILKIADIIKEVAQPEKLVLFGSYATGNWVEDRYFENGIRYEYISDYDFLVVTQNNTEKDYILSDRIVNRARHITNVAVNPIIHDMEYVTKGWR
jgi:predicted nucleotidyltransferase